VQSKHIKSITCCYVSCLASASTRLPSLASIANCWWSNWKDLAARVDPRGPRPKMFCPAMTDFSLPRYDDCEDNAAAVAHDPDVAGWHDAIVVASSPDCCRWHRMATAMPLTHFTKIKVFFSCYDKAGINSCKKFLTKTCSIFVLHEKNFEYFKTSVLTMLKDQL